MLQAANNQHLQLFSTATGDEILRIEKYGDFGIETTAFDGRLIAFSDCKETQIFCFDKVLLKLKKLTRRICSQNGIERLPPASFLAFQPVECREHEVQLVMLTKDLQICTVNVESSEISQVCDKATFEQTSEMRPYDQIVTAFHFNPVANRLVVALANKAYLSVIDLSEKNKLVWRLPALGGKGAPLVFASDMDKLLVGYDSNHIAIFDLLKQEIHPWTA